MRRYWRRFIYRNKYDKFPLWLYLMLLQTLVLGIAFTFFGASPSVHASVLYQITTGFDDAYVSLWGLAAIAAVLLSVVNLLTRYRPISVYGPYLGYGVWAYALLVYVLYGYWMQAITAGIWLTFWIYHHIRLMTYRHNVDTGVEEPPD